MSSRAIVLGLVLVVTAGLAVRVAIAPDAGELSDVDSDLHLRRAQAVLTRGPRTLIDVDPMLSWPDGARVSWPPGFDLALAGLARVVAPSRLDAVAGVVVAVV